MQVTTKNDKAGGLLLGSNPWISINLHASTTTCADIPNNAQKCLSLRDPKRSFPRFGDILPIALTTVQHVMAEDLRNPDIQSRVDDFTTKLDKRLDDSNFVLPGNDIDYYYQTDQYAVDYKNRDLQQLQ